MSQSRNSEKLITKGINITILDGSAGSSKSPIFDEKTGEIVGYEWEEHNLAGKTLEAVRVIRPDGSSYLR